MVRLCSKKTYPIIKYRINIGCLFFRDQVIRYSDIPHQSYLRGKIKSRGEGREGETPTSTGYYRIIGLSDWFGAGILPYPILIRYFNQVKYRIGKNYAQLIKRLGYLTYMKYRIGYTSQRQIDEEAA